MGRQSARDSIDVNMSGKQVEISEGQLAQISKAVADPARFQILQKIANSDEAPTCSCMCDWTGLSPATISHHLKELDAAGLIEIQRSGKFAHLLFRRDVWTAYVKKLSTL